MRRHGDELIFEGDGSSSLEATVRMSPKDAAKMLGAFFRSPSAIGYALSLPFLWLRGDSAKGGQGENASGEQHPFNALNDPW